MKYERHNGTIPFWTPDKIQKIQELLKDHSQKKIGEMYGVSAQRIHALIQQHGLKVEKNHRNKNRDAKGHFVKGDGTCSLHKKIDNAQPDPFLNKLPSVP
jgi:uncharacterized protein YjcR